MGNKVITYNTDDGKNSVKLFAKDSTVWLNQQLMAEFFDTSKQNINYHIANILKKIDKIANSIFDKIVENIFQIHTLTQLRDNLLSKLMNGQMEII